MAVAEDDPRRRGLHEAGWTDDRPRFHPPIPLVEAKLLPPAPRAGIIERARLIRLLTAEPAASIVSIVAPPGYGKRLERRRAFVGTPDEGRALRDVRHLCRRGPGRLPSR
jgi:hypothetical protein